jgi:hypothetical protein
VQEALNNAHEGNSLYAGAVPLGFLADCSIIQAFLPMPLKPIKSGSAQRYLQNHHRSIIYKVRRSIIYRVHSHTALNQDKVDHFLLFDTSDNKNGLGGSDVIVAIEDLYGIGVGTGGADFNDMVAGITDVAPVPEPATMLLLGTGLIGLAGMGRKKLSKQNPTV